MYRDILPGRVVPVAIAAVAFIAISAVVLLLPASPAQAQMTQGADVNVSRLANYQNECSIIANPTNKNQLFAACNNATGDCQNNPKDG